MKRAQVFCVILTIFLAVLSQYHIAAAQIATQTGSETIESYDRATEVLTISVAYSYQWPSAPTIRSFTLPPEEDLLGEPDFSPTCTRINARTIQCPGGTTSFSIAYRYQLQINVTGDGTQFTYLSDFDREFAPTDAMYDLFYPDSWGFLSVSPEPTVEGPGHFQWVRQNISAFVAQVRFQIAPSSEPQPSKMMGTPSCQRPRVEISSNLSCSSGALRASNTSALGGQCVNQQVGNPCDPGSGNKYQVKTDYASAGVFPLLFQRFYNSLVPHRASIGENWTNSYSQNVTLTPSGLAAVVTRPDGKALTFASQGNAWIPDADVTDHLEQLTNAAGWRYTTSEEDTVEAYNAAGQLVSITNRAGLVQTLAYDAQGRLISVTDPFGRTLALTYDAADRIATLADPAGGVYTYSYDAENNLASVRYPDGATRTYLYEDTRFPNALTGITDENGQRFATFAYDANGKVTLSTHAGGAGQVTLTYNADGTTTVVDALGTARTYGFATIQGVRRNTSVSAPCTACGNVTAATTYDANGNVASRTDFNGHVTQYAYDLTRNLETSRVEAFGTPEARTITTAWHPVFRLPIRIAAPLRITTYTYDDTGATCGARGALCSLTLQATGDPAGAQGFNAPLTGTPRISTFTYDRTGQILTVDGPRRTVQDITTNAYDQQGNLIAVTNAVGQVTQVPQYDAHGNPLTSLDPNGLVATLAYDARQRVISRTVGTETTSFTYDGVGQVTQVTLPDGSFLGFSYDTAHRLIAMQDSAGDKIAYTLDAMGNRVEEDVFDPQGTLTQTRSRVYDSLTRLAQELGAQLQVTQYAYDRQGNRTRVTDLLNHTTANGYDALNRLVSMTDPANGTTFYAYDGLDQLISVADPRSLATHYTVTGLNELTHTLSPDTGTTQNAYDEAGNLITSVDAKGQTTRTAYDALNRVTQVVYADGATHTYTYDQGPNGIGRLTQITDPSGTTSYAYDLQGRVLTETRVIGGITYVTGYQYNVVGQMVAMTSPSGHVVGYAYDTANRIAAVTLDGQPLLNTIGYQPFGGVAGWVFANGAPYARGYDPDGRIETYALGAETRTLTYDPAGRILGVDASDPQRDRTFDYDALDRLTQFITPSTTQTYTYDAVGNRTSQTIGANNYSYQIAGNSNRLLSVSGPTPKTYTYDANGSVTQDSLHPFVYDARNRLVQVNSTQYAINALGQRVGKTAGGGTTVYHYDIAGHLIAERDAAGTGKDYVYLYDIPVAVLVTLPAAAPQLYYLYTDHLNTTRLVTDTNNKVVWRWDNSDPFGAGVPEADPHGDGQAFAFNLRFPGQYFDQETGLHYNYFRDYEPGIGRYIESDPIGLAGGVNTYAYVNNNPLNFGDPSGLQSQIHPPDEPPLESFYPETLLLGGPVLKLGKTGIQLLCRVFAAEGTTSIVGQVTVNILFKTEHYASRLAAKGLNVAEVEKVVQTEIAAISNYMTAGSTVSGRLTINNVLIEFRARLLPSGQISVGTIFPVK